MRKPPKGKSLAEVNPEIAKEWHPSKNGDLTPWNVTPGSGKKVWWKCPKGTDHEWEAIIRSRNSGVGCHICKGKIIVNSNCLATLFPKIASEWHPSKNGELSPDKVGAKGWEKVWWKCPKGEDHEWEAQIYTRTKGAGCPVCSGQKAVKSNSLAEVNPELAQEWHPTKNGDLSPSQITPGSEKKVWWKCPKGNDHEWEASPNNRSRAGCPYCSGRKASSKNNLLVLYPDLCIEWHQTKNRDLSPSQITPGSSKKVWWKCSKNPTHIWQSTIDNRVKGNGCPHCAGQILNEENNLLATFPRLALEWHPSKNGKLKPDQVHAKSGKKVWWKCPKGDDHEWQAPVYNRANGNGCPICSGKKVVRTNSLEAKFPELALEWNTSRNGNLKPGNLTPGSNRKVWWKCPKGDDHEWEATVASRVSGNGCAVCSGYKIVNSNSLATLNPRLANEWHPGKNGNISANDVGVGSNKIVWWLCSRNPTHEWKASINNRTKDRGCPYCTLTPQSRQELLITFELKQFFDIDPKGFKTKIDGKMWTIDIFIEELNLGIEFDGNYWHKDKRSLDKLKTEKLHEEGFTIMRIREEPLKPITDIDVVSKRPFNGKKVTNDILKHILEVYEIDSKRVKKMKEYFRKRKLQNEDALDVYIDQILEEKAERKRKKK